MYGGTILHIQALDLPLMKKWLTPKGGHTRELTANFNISVNSNLYSKQLKGMNQRLAGSVLMKKPEAKFLMSVSL